MLWIAANWTCWRLPTLTQLAQKYVVFSRIASLIGRRGKVNVKRAGLEDKNNAPVFFSVIIGYAAGASRYGEKLRKWVNTEACIATTMDYFMGLISMVWTSCCVDQPYCLDEMPCYNWKVSVVVFTIINQAAFCIINSIIRPLKPVLPLSQCLSVQHFAFKRINLIHYSNQYHWQIPYSLGVLPIWKISWFTD